MRRPKTGYAEGFYGRLLSWPERCQILDTLQRLRLTTYYYAPKEDACHRLVWRQAYSDQWLTDFQQFCTLATERGIRVVAGVAPGLDFDFSHLPDGADFKSLLSKCKQLLDNGAHDISLLMDDIDADFDQRSGPFSQEGQAHASLANALGDALTSANSSEVCLWVTPRIYADELIDEAPEYLSAFVSTLENQHCILYCGRDVVAKHIDTDFARALEQAAIESDQSLHEVIVWDNLYANDYCPRRLFVGPWRGRMVCSVLLNPTGMVHTDCLLLDLMADGLALAEQHAADAQLSEADLPAASLATMQAVWQATLKRHGVPEEFLAIAPFFYYPVCNLGVDQSYDLRCTDSERLRSAIEHCLWRWKTPLSREWYPAIFGLKHDLLTLAGQQSPLRVLKTQNLPLVRVLLGTDNVN